MRERDFHSFEKGFKYQLCLRNAVEIAVVLLLIQSMKYAARLVSRENEVIREFRFRSVDITTIKKWHYKKRQDDEARDDVKHDMHSSSRSRNKDPNTKLNK